MASRSAGPESIPAWAIAVLVLVGLLLLVCASCVGLFGWNLMRKRREEKYGKSTMEHWQMRKSLPPNSGSGSGSGEPKGGKKTPRGTTPVLPHDRMPVDVGSKKTASGLMAGKFSASGKVVSDADNSKKSDSMDSRKGKKSSKLKVAHKFWLGKKKEVSPEAITAGRSTIGAASASSSSGGPPSRETPPTEKSAKGKKKPKKKMSDSGSSESVSSSRKSMPSTPNVTMPTPSPSVGPARMSVSVKTAKSMSVASKA